MRPGALSLSGTYFYGVFDLMDTFAFFFLFVNIICAGYCMNKAQESGKKIGSYFVLGMLLGPIGAIVAKAKAD